MPAGERWRLPARKERTLIRAPLRSHRWHRIEARLEASDAATHSEPRSQLAAKNAAFGFAVIRRAGARAGADDVLSPQLFRQVLGALSATRLTQGAREVGGRS